MLIKYEWQKLFSGKTKWFLFLLIIVNALLFYLYLVPSASSEEKKLLYNEVKKEVEEKGGIEEGIQELDAQSNVLLDKQSELLESGSQELLSDSEELRLQVLNEVKEEYQDVLNFTSFIEKIDAEADRLLSFSIFSDKGSFSNRNIRKTHEDFSALKGIKAEPENGSGLIMLQNYLITDLLLIAGICILSFQIFGKDGRSGVQKLLNASVKGRGTLRLVQSFTVIFATIMLAMIIYGSNIIQTQIVIGFPRMEVDIHGIAEYRNIAFPCTTKEYLILFSAWKTGAAVTVCTLFQGIIYRFSGSKFSWLILGILIGSGFLLWFYLPENPISKIFRYLNVIGIFDTAEFIGDYQNLNLFTIPVGLLEAGKVLMLAVFVIGILSIILFAPSTITIFRKNRQRKNRNIRTVNVFLYEGYKWVWIQKGGIILLLLTAMVIYIEVPEISKDEIITRTDYHYEQMAKSFIGKSDKDLEAAVADLEDESKTFIDSAQYEAAEQVTKQAEYILELDCENAAFVNQRVWNHIFFDKDKELTHFMLFLLAAVFSMSGIFQYETSSRMKVLLCSSLKRRKIFWSKFGTACLECCFYSGIVWGGFYTALYMKYGEVPGAGYSVKSLEQFSDVQSNLSIGEMLGGVIIQRLAAGIALAVILFIFSGIFLTTIQFVAAGVIAFILPTALLIVGNMDSVNSLTSLIRFNLEPILSYIYAFSSWTSMIIKIPVYVYIVFVITVGAALWRCEKNWRK